MANKQTPAHDHAEHPWNAVARASVLAPVGLLLIDPSAKVRFANPEALNLLRLSAPEVEHKPVADLFHAEDAAIHAMLREVIGGDRSRNERMTLHLSDGATTDCDVSVHPITEDGQEVCYALWLNDVSDHVAMQRSLLQAERLSALGEIVAGVAHELNNPLTGILGFAELLLKNETDDKKRGRLESIVAEAMRCQAIVQSLRGFSAKGEAESAFHSINQIVDSMVTLLEYQMRVDHIDVVRYLDPSEPTVYVDAHSVGRAVLNIVHNAHQALESVSDRHRRFSVATEADNNEIRIRFNDNGPGIKPEHLDRIFDPFFTTREFGSGVGLGLSVAYGAIREHGGRIEVRSTPGEGTEFVIHLPRDTAR